MLDRLVDLSALSQKEEDPNYENERGRRVPSGILVRHGASTMRPCVATITRFLHSLKLCNVSPKATCTVAQRESS